jgi:hypothetical protein
VSINVSQIFVRYPDEKDAAGILAELQKKTPGGPSSIVVRTPSPWLAISAADNAPAPEPARTLSRALEASGIWYGLAGNTLAYRMIRYELGRETSKILVPEEIFQPEAASVLPMYRDVEQELHRRLLEAGIPAEYIYLFIEEIGISGKDGEKEDAAAVRGGRFEPFRHRVPRRGSEGVRTLFDLYKEGEETVYEMLHLHGAFDESRAEHLFRTLEGVCRRRSLPAGWKVTFLAGSVRDPELGRQLATAHSRGRYSFDLAAPPSE